MRAAVASRYGPPEVIELVERPVPQPKAGEVLVKVKSSGVNSGDARLRGARFPAGFGPVARAMFGFFRPRNGVFGAEAAGTVEAVGKDVTAFQPGDAVFCDTSSTMGAHAEYVCVKADGPIAHVPKSVPVEAAGALVFGPATAIHFLGTLGGLKAGERVLVNGASGAVGCAAVQVARNLGAEVTAVCSAQNADLVTSLGAHRVIDYGETDFTTLGERWDVVMDLIGNAGWKRSRPVLTPQGRLLMVTATLVETIGAGFVSKKTGQRAVTGVSMPDKAMLGTITDMVEAGALRPVIDRVFPFSAIREAHALVDSGRKRGSVIVTM